MADPRTLLQRLHDSPRAPRGGDDDGVLAASVMANLAQVIGTARWSCPLDPDYGFPTQSEFAHAITKRPCDDPQQPLLQEMKRHLRLLIERYEPRLRLAPDGLTILVDRSDPLLVGYRIHGTLQHEQGHEAEVTCQATVGRHGAWMLEEGM